MVFGSNYFNLCLYKIKILRMFIYLKRNDFLLDCLRVFILYGGKIFCNVCSLKLEIFNFR